MKRLPRLPTKGLEYFSFDTAFFSDPKVKIVKARYGSDGVLLYLYLLCSIYHEGYYLQIDDDFIYVVSADLNMDSEKIGQVLNYLLSRSLFDNTLFQSVKVLTSHGIQIRFQKAVKSRAVKNPVTVDKRFWLLSEEETETFIKVRPCEDNSGKNEDNSRNNEDNSRNYSTKESKVKKRKGNTPCSPPSFIREIQDMYRSICKGLDPLPDRPHYQREQSILRLWKLHPDIQDFRSVFEKAEKSAFLRGARGGFKASFDWLIRVENFEKTMQGRYDDAAPASKTAEGVQEKSFSELLAERKQA